MAELFDLPFEDAEPAEEPPHERRVYTVSELAAQVRALVEGGFGVIWLEGELSNCRLWNTGHFYFSLKDAGAQIRGVMFRSAARSLTFEPEDGLHVLVRGRVTIYETKGEYQLVCELMQPRGVGERQMAFERLKKRLHAEGLFDEARKRPLPALPRKIGVVTSLDGAALRDIVKVIRRRFRNAHLVVRPARVQGEGAADDIARGLAAIARVDGIDVVIVGRGGGSQEDLWAFNEEVVARAIAACPVPVVAGVGHQTDFTIADFVADVRAATPSNAAELVLAAKSEFAARIERLAGRLRASVRRAVDTRRASTHALEARPGLAGVPGRLASMGRRTSDATHDLRAAAREQLARRWRSTRDLLKRLEQREPRVRLANATTRLVTADARLRAALSGLTAHAAQRLGAQAARLGALSPLAVLGRGYAVCWAGDRQRILREATPDLVGQPVTVTLHRGELACEVRAATPPRAAGSTMTGNGVERLE